MGKKILVADDMTTIVTMVKCIFEEEGFEVVTASDGVEAVKKAFKEMPDLIVMDLMMPKLNGYQACRLLKEEVLTGHIPIIILTGQDKAIDKFWAMQTGADEYLLKDLIVGFKSEELIKKAKELLSKNTKKEKIENFDTQVDESGIFMRINDLLDRKLLESTVLNEISRLGKTIYDEEKTMTSIMSMLQKIINFDTGLIILKDEKKVLIYQKGTLVEENKDIILNRALEHFNSMLGLVINKSELNIQIFEEKITNNINKTLNSFLVSDLSSRGSIIGLILLSSYSEDVYTEKDKKLLNLIVNQTSIVMDNARLYQKVESLSITDELTKMYNKRYLAQMFPLELNRIKRNNSILSLIMFDIDFFKNVNDTYGHLQGDIILREVGRIAKEEIRKIDFPIRYGGEEFMLILPGVNLAAAKNIAERLRAVVEKFSFPSQQGALHITISLGVGLCNKENADEDGKTIIKLVDEALYKAKKSGRNQVCLAGE
jgi:two-component system cell cycle response regulator